MVLQVVYHGVLNVSTANEMLAHIRNPVKIPLIRAVNIRVAWWGKRGAKEVEFMHRGGARVSVRERIRSQLGHGIPSRRSTGHVFSMGSKNFIHLYLIV